MQLSHFDLSSLQQEILRQTATDDRDVTYTASGNDRDCIILAKLEGCTKAVCHSESVCSETSICCSPVGQCVFAYDFLMIGVADIFQHELGNGPIIPQVYFCFGIYWCHLEGGSRD